jgi:hypothetical protein
VITIDGEVVDGIGRAHTAIAFQLPHLIGRFPVLAGCHPGSVNLRLAEALRINNADFLTPPIQWYPQSIEQFAFLEVAFESPLGEALRRAWIYMPANSPHFYDVYHVELIAPFLSGGTATGTRCRIHIDKPHTTRNLIVI